MTIASPKPVGTAYGDKERENISNQDCLRKLEGAALSAALNVGGQTDLGLYVG